eukprot:9521149-Alexandrium_andersonii.AAC.1
MPVCDGVGALGLHMVTLHTARAYSDTSGCMWCTCVAMHARGMNVYARVCTCVRKAGAAHHAHVTADVAHTRVCMASNTTAQLAPH